jgi:hypothetical protein
MQTIKKLNFVFERYWVQNLAQKLAMLTVSGFAQSLKENSFYIISNSVFTEYLGARGSVDG